MQCLDHDRPRDGQHGQASGARQHLRVGAGAWPEPGAGLCLGGRHDGLRLVPVMYG